jgi:hypothetical protein
MTDMLVIIDGREVNITEVNTSAKFNENPLSAFRTYLRIGMAFGYITVVQMKPVRGLFWPNE